MNSWIRTLGSLTLACGALLVSDVRADEPASKPEQKPEARHRRQREDGQARQGPRDGEARKEGARDGDRPKEGARDGDRPKEGARDGDRPKEGPRDGERPRQSPPDGGPRERADRLNKALGELNLTDDQKAQIKTIQDETRAKMESLREELKDLTPEQRREKTREAVGDVRAKLEAVLTDEQKTQLREKMQAERPRDGERPKDGPRDGDRPKDGPRDGERPKDGPPDDGQGPRADGDRPGDREAPPPGRGAAFERIKSNLATLDLTADQKSKADAILADAAAKLAKLREQGDLDNLREKAGEVFNEVRAKLGEILTPEQKQKMAELAPRRPEGEGPPGDRPPEGDRPRDRGKAKEPAAGANQNSDTAAAKAAVVSSSAPTTAPATPGDRFAPGQPAPDFRLKNLSGKVVSLQNLRAKPTVIVFGSFTSPTTRDRVPQFDELRKNYRNKANFVFIYTREAYPQKEWELKRNLDEQIKIDQHADYNERVKMAKLTREGMKLDTEVLVDDVDDGIATAYDAMPNACVVIDAAGRIVGRQKWADPHGAKVWLDEALRTK